MTREELEKRLVHMEQEHNEAKQQLIKIFCLENNPYSIGDIITNGNDIIKIDKIYYSSIDIGCVYRGQKYSKKLEPLKSAHPCHISQKYVTKKLN